MECFPPSVVVWALVLQLSRQSRAGADLGRLDNYANVLSDSDIWDRLHNTVIMGIMTVTTQMVVGFLLALLFSKTFPLRRYLMILVLTPMMLSFVAVGAFFRYYYDPTFGLLSQAVRLFTGQPFILMSTVWGSRIGIVFADAWMWSPFVMLLVLAGLVSVPNIFSTKRPPSTASRTGASSGRSRSLISAGSCFLRFCSGRSRPSSCSISFSC